MGFETNNLYKQGSIMHNQKIKSITRNTMKTQLLTALLFSAQLARAQEDDQGSDGPPSVLFARCDFMADAEGDMEGTTGSLFFVQKEGDEMKTFGSL